MHCSTSHSVFTGLHSEGCWYQTPPHQTGLWTTTRDTNAVHNGGCHSTLLLLLSLQCLPPEVCSVAIFPCKGEGRKDVSISLYSLPPSPPSLSLPPSLPPSLPSHSTAAWYSSFNRLSSSPQSTPFLAHSLSGLPGNAQSGVPVGDHMTNTCQRDKARQSNYT